MLKALRGLILATGALSVPLFVQADCPPEDSIDRYAQTAGDALVALHELVPESQRLALEDRYAAMIIMKWQWQGRDAMRSDDTMMDQLLTCYQANACGIDGEDQITLQIVEKLADFETDPLLLESLLPRQPSASALTWAETTLDCALTSELEPAELPEPEAELDSNLVPEDFETDEDSLAEETPAPAAEPESIEMAEVTPTPAPLPPAESELDAEQQTEIQDVSLDLPTNEIESPIVEETVVIAPEPEPVPMNSDVAELMLKATNLVAMGKAGQAITPLETACFIEAPQVQTSSACETLFSIYLNRSDAPETSTGSQSYLTLADQLCEAGYGQGCVNLGRYHNAQNTPDSRQTAIDYAERACALSNADACVMAADLYSSDPSGEINVAAARDSLAQACQLGRLETCQSVADDYLRGIGGEANTAMAIRMVEASCPPSVKGRADLCVSAADFVLLNEVDSAARGARVRTLIARACKIGHDVGCAWYAEDLELGIGGAVDITGAREARLIACEFGDTESCNSRS